MILLRDKIIILTALLFLPAWGVYASTWPEPVIIDAGLNNGYRTDIAFDQAGNAIAVFEQKAGDIYRLYANQYIKGKGWQKPLAIDANTGNAYRGKVAFDRQGNAIAVFKQEGNNGYRLYANMYIEGKGWQGSVAIDDGPGLVDGHKVIFNDSGNAAVVFEQYDGKVFRIYVNIFTPGRGWQGPVKIDNGIANTYFPYPLFDNIGNLYVIYYQEITGGLDVYASRYEGKKGEWIEPVRISDGSHNIKNEDWEEKKSLLRQGISGIYNPIFWDEMKKRIYSGSYPYGAGASWETPSKIDARFRDAYTPTLLVNESGEVTAFFVKWDGKNLRGYSAVYKAGKGWGRQTLIDAGGGDVEHIRAALNSRGDIAVVFTQWVKNNLRVHARIFRPGSGWEEAQIIDAGEKSAYNPSVVFTGAGEIIAVWCQWEEFNVKSYANIYRDKRGWSKARRLEKDKGETCGVRIASAPDGSAIAVFEQEGEYTDNHLSLNRIFAVKLDSRFKSEK